MVRNMEVGSVLLTYSLLLYLYMKKYHQGKIEYLLTTNFHFFKNLLLFSHSASKFCRTFSIPLLFTNVLKRISNIKNSFIPSRMCIPIRKIPPSYPIPLKLQTLSLLQEISKHESRNILTFVSIYLFPFHLLKAQ